MEALLVFDPQNNLISTKCDQLFAEHVFRFAAQTGIRTNSQDSNNNETLRNLLAVFVTPFVVSHKYMANDFDLKFDCIPNMRAVYSKNREFFLLYIYESHENHVIMQRKVDIFGQIIQFMSGPVIHSLVSDSNLIQIVFKVIDHWKTLSQSMTFMLESVERLLVGNELLKTCNDILHKIHTKIQAILKYSVEMPTHIYLFYGIKYISSLASDGRTKISRGDMLLMMLLAQTLNAMADADQKNSQEEARRKSDSFSVDRRSYLDNFSKLSLREGIARSNSKKTSKQNQFLVFLQSSDDQKVLVPYVYRKITIKDSLYFIVLSEIPRQLSSNLMQLIGVIESLVNEPNVKKCCHTVIQMENCIKRLKEFIFKKNLCKERVFESLLNNLTKLQDIKIFEYLTDSDKNLLNLQTEAKLAAINNTFRHNYKTLVFDFFNTTILRAHPLDTNLFNEIVFYCMKVFSDYLPFLKVKSQRNMTLLGVDVNITGLVGFVYIDRTANEVITAPIESASYDTNICIINMIYEAYTGLTDGQMSRIWSDGVLQYCYVIWFEDSAGNELSPRHRSFKLDSYPSIIAGNFVQDMINKCFCQLSKANKPCHMWDGINRSTISCYPYELFTVYKSDQTLDETTAGNNCRKLAKKLWEIGISSHI